MSVRELTKENFAAEVTQAGKKTVVEFWAPLCVYCKRLGPVIDRLAAKLGETLPVGKVNVDEQPELAQAFGIMSIPTLLVFKGGKVVNKAVGVKPKQAILQMLEV